MNVVYLFPLGCFDLCILEQRSSSLLARSAKEQGVKRCCVYKIDLRYYSAFGFVGCSVFFPLECGFWICFLVSHGSGVGLILDLRCRFWTPKNMMNTGKIKWFCIRIQMLNTFLSTRRLVKAKPCVWLCPPEPSTEPTTSSCYLHNPCKTPTYWHVVLQVKFHNTKPTKVCNETDFHSQIQKQNWKVSSTNISD